MRDNPSRQSKTSTELTLLLMRMSVVQPSKIQPSTPSKTLRGAVFFAAALAALGEMSQMF